MGVIGRIYTNDCKVGQPDSPLACYAPPSILACKLLDHCLEPQLKHDLYTAGQRRCYGATLRLYISMLKSIPFDTLNKHFKLGKNSTNE